MTPESACGWTGRVGYVYFRMTIADPRIAAPANMAIAKRTTKLSKSG